MKYRILVEKREQFRVEAKSFERDLNESLGLKINGLRIVNLYDVDGFDQILIEKTKYSVFGEIATDVVTIMDEREAQAEARAYNHPLSPTFSLGSRFAIEPLPGQFDQRAASAVDCVRLVDPKASVRISAAKLIIFPEKLTFSKLEKIKQYCINAVECREKDLRRVGPETTDAQQTAIREEITGFCTMDNRQLELLIRDRGLSINVADLICIRDYFVSEHREPTVTELMILDTYWSDHCRHTTFNTVIESIEIEPSFISSEITSTLKRYKIMRKELKRANRDMTLMDMASIGARWCRANGFLDDLEQSEENNACSIFVTVNVRRGDTVTPEKWLLQFKNETHNHPTEIEPFGGAATCLGGAIRDPLSGRAYVYQAMRVTGAGNIYTPVRETLRGKLPQRTITRKAAAGYSSYGNQIGLATTHVSEIYHPDYVAKRMEVGAVVGASPASAVRRVSPVPGDIVLMFGGRTGRDGVGGASGSSKKHDGKSLTTCGSEVQKGNAPEERKIQRLMRRPDVSSLIKKANDFGAGGVSVAVGELADGLDIFLDRVLTKYDGLTTTELAISESQERMAVVIDAADKKSFMAKCAEENLEVVHIANVTDTNRMRIYRNGETVVDLSREFIDSAGAKRFTDIVISGIERINPFKRELEGRGEKVRFENNLRDPNVQSQKGMVEMFDATIGASTVLMPYGGSLQRSETQVSVQKLPVLDGETDDASMMAFGFDPYLSSWSPYHGAAYSVVDACAKVVAAGGDYSTMRFSYQEYYRKMNTPEAWGLPTAALLGALKMQYDLHLPSIGGKDSMSGTFEKISVPPTLIAFGITMVDARKVISTDFKHSGKTQYVYLLEPHALRNFMPDTDSIRNNFDYFHSLTEKGIVSAARAIGRGGVAEALAKMAFGSKVGADIKYRNLFDVKYGAILFTSVEDNLNAAKIGEIRNDGILVVNDIEYDIDTLYKINNERFSAIYPENAHMVPDALATQESRKKIYAPETIERPIVYIPIFPGTNCDYDMKRAFERAGAEVRTSVFRNLTATDISESIAEMAENIRNAHILAFAGGFSSGDEPDGSAKFIANVINNNTVGAEIEGLINRKGLILGICNGFQALVKSGLLPYGHLGQLTPNSPTLFRNDCNRHISQMVTTRVASVRSPWLQNFELGEEHTVAVSHGEGRFVCSKSMAETLVEKGQVAFQYVSNPNGSTLGIEGIISENGLILGKMAHSERYVDNVFKNIDGNKSQNIFANAVAYFRHK